MRRATPEQIIQKAVVQHLRQRAVEGLVWFHPNNNIARGGKAGAIQGRQAKEMGVLAGVSDLILFHGGRLFCLELKDEKGRPTEAQLRFQSDVARQGAYTSIADGVDRAIRTLELWGLLRGAATAMRGEFERRVKDAAA